MKGHGRQYMGSLKDVFCKRVQIYQGPTKDISVGRLWDNNQHERRTYQRRGIRKAPETGGSASEFGHSDGSRQTGIGRAIHQQRDANTLIADSNSDDRNAATGSSKLRVRSNATDRNKRTAAVTGKPTTPTQSKL